MSPPILPPLLHAALLFSWQDEVVALAPVPAVLIANLAVSRDWARVMNVAICAGAAALVGLDGLYSLLLAISGGTAPWPGLILFLAGSLGGAAVFRPVRVALARLLPLLPDSPLNLLALEAVILVVGLQANYQAGHDALTAVTSSGQLQPVDVLGQELPLLLMALLGAGLFTRRAMAPALVRLGVVRPAAWQVLAALAAAGLFLAASVGAQELQRWLDPALAGRLEQATSHYYGGINGVFGIGVIALAPGISEEAFFRGALQPRLGIWLSALAFAAVHTQYALTVDTLLVFALGAALGVVRRALNTTCSITAHAAYNALAGLGLPTDLLPWALPVEAVLALLAVMLWLRDRRLSEASRAVP